MESPLETGMDTMPPIPLCVHEIHPELIIGRSPEGFHARLGITGHDEHGTTITVDMALPGDLMDQLSSRLQEFQVSATMVGMSKRQPRLFRNLRRAVLDHRPAGGQDNG